MIYDEKFKSENGINELEEEDWGIIDGDCDNKFVDGEVEVIKFEIGLLLLLLLFRLVEFIVAVVEGDAVEGDDVDNTDGEEDEDGWTRKSCWSLEVSGHCCCDNDDADGDGSISSGFCCGVVWLFTLTFITVLNVKWCVGVWAFWPLPLLLAPPHSMSIFWVNSAWNG